MVTKYVQPNGLRVILEPVSSSVSVSAGLWLTRGSRNEKSDEYGYAHFVEHMLFEGTQKYSVKELAKMVDRVGGQHNAATDREYTCYYINIMADHLDMAVDILSEMYYHPLFDAKELEKEKNVILEEIMMCEESHDEYVYDLFSEYMLPGHPLSHPILGTSGIIESASSSSLREFYHNNYRNENAIFVVAGNFNIEKAKELIGRHFESNNGNPNPPAGDIPLHPERVRFKHAKRNIEQVHFCMGTEGIKRNDDDRWALYILSTILGGSMSSRLFQKIREDMGLCYSIYSFHLSYSDLGLFGIYCATGRENFHKTVGLIADECRLLLKDGITAAELEDAKTFIKGSLALSLESVEVRMGQIVKNEITFGRHFSFDDTMKQIDGVSRDDFMRLAARLFEGKELSLISVGRMPRGLRKRKPMDLRM
ncbi:MAG: insulinase family protein [Spirochaetia bacterium]|jgi:predicted Zn-dependent peptidase|nr:insulinase family protein [Spirochaetia bacterium]